jgi:hypothetical protein
LWVAEVFAVSMGVEIFDISWSPPGITTGTPLAF